MGRLEVSSVERFWWRRTMSSKRASALLGGKCFIPEFGHTEQIGFEIAGERAVGFGRGLVGLEFAHQALNTPLYTNPQIH